MSDVYKDAKIRIEALAQEVVKMEALIREAETSYTVALEKALADPRKSDPASVVFKQVILLSHKLARAELCITIQSIVQQIQWQALSAMGSEVESKLGEKDLAAFKDLGGMVN